MILEHKEHMWTVRKCNNKKCGYEMFISQDFEIEKICHKCKEGKLEIVARTYEQT